MGSSQERQVRMIWFSYFYLGQRMMLMDLVEDRRNGMRAYVASLSEDPRICFRARRAEDALNQLVAYMRGLQAREDARAMFWQQAPASYVATAA
jgi:hypothetical protein